MKNPHVVCLNEATGALIFSVKSFDYRLSEGDLFNHISGGTTTKYKVETAVLEVNSRVGAVEPTRWTEFVLRLTATVIP